MSRLGRRGIAIPEKVNVTIEECVLVVTGPRGEVSRPIRQEIEVTTSDGTVMISPKKDTKFAHILWGTYASHVANMLKGVSLGFEKKLVIEGVGYRAEVSGNTLVLSVGFSHKVQLPIPEELTVTVEKNNITISGADKETVGQFAATVRGVRKPEPYKGKGIRYEEEVIRRKQGKKAVT